MDRKPFDVDSKYIKIKYFAYDLKKDAVGAKKELLSSALFLNSQETVVAQFVLSEDFPLKGVDMSYEYFWQTLSLEAGFKNGGAKSPEIKGLTLITSEAYLKETSTSYSALWDKDYKVRRRSSRQYTG